MMVRFLFMVALVLMMVTSPAQAEQNCDPGPTDSTVVIPFDPPLGKPLKYKVTVSENGAIPRSAIQILTFRVLPNGHFVVHSETDPLDNFANLPPQQRAYNERMLRDLSRVDIELDADGTPIAMYDWPRTRARMRSIMLHILPEKPGMDTEALIRAALPEDPTAALNIVWADFIPAMGWGGSLVCEGFERNTETETPIPLLATTVPTTTTTRVVAIERGKSVKIKVVMGNRGEIDENINGSMNGFIDRIDPEKKAPVRKIEQKPVRNLKFRDSSETIIDLVTGLPTWTEARNQASANDRQKSRHTVIELIP